MNKIIIKENKKKVINLLTLGIIMSLLSIYILVNGLIEIKIFYTIIGTVGTVFFCGSFIFMVKSSLTHKPPLIIGEDGITDMSTVFSVGFIPWEEIKSVYVKKICYERAIGITVHDINTLTKRISFLKQVGIKINLFLNYPPVAINLSTADVEFNEVLELVQNRLEEYRGYSI